MAKTTEELAGVAFRGHLRALDEAEMEIAALEQRQRDAADEAELRLLRIHRRLLRKWARKAQQQAGVR